MAQNDLSSRPGGSQHAGAGKTQEVDLFAIPLDWGRWWTIIPETIVLCCTGILPVVVVVNVVARYTNWYHVIWAEDVVKVLFLWIVFLGGAIAVKYEAHVRMSMLSDRLVGRGRAGAFWAHVIRLSPLAIGAILLILGVPIVEISMHRELPTLRITSAYFMTIVPISGALMIFYVVRGFLGNRRGPGTSAGQTGEKSG